MTLNHEEFPLPHHSGKILHENENILLLLSTFLTQKENKSLKRPPWIDQYPRSPTHSTDTLYTSNLPNPGIFAYSTHVAETQETCHRYCVARHQKSQTSFVFEVAETQEPATHPVAETQEPDITGIEIELQWLKHKN